MSLGQKVNALLTMIVRVNIPSAAESQFEQGTCDEEANSWILGLDAWRRLVLGV
jgi:hypothetical protein